MKGGRKERADSEETAESEGERRALSHVSPRAAGEQPAFLPPQDQGPGRAGR